MTTPAEPNESPAPRRYALDALKLAIYLDAKRSALDMTWKELGDAMGVSASALSRIQRGTNPDADALVAISMFLGIEIAKVAVLV